MGSRVSGASANREMMRADLESRAHLVPLFDEGTASGSRAARGWGHEGKKRPELREVKEEEGGNREGDVNMKLEQTLQAEPST